MNERIRELVKQADGVFIHKLMTGAKQYTFLEKDLEKFAELIVRECINKITTYDLVPGHSAKWEDIYDIHTRLLQDLGEELKEHFGVEE
ncbi:MAG: hypothetical protein EBU90_16240 [Proteobacteria bacterium]|nr:hypothetical protein [Pseudomonadota bacterium]